MFVVAGRREDRVVFKSKVEFDCESGADTGQKEKISLHQLPKGEVADFAAVD